MDIEENPPGTRRRWLRNSALPGRPAANPCWKSKWLCRRGSSSARISAIRAAQLWSISPKEIEPSYYGHSIGKWVDENQGGTFRCCGSHFD
jgi:hypothetical protein